MITETVSKVDVARRQLDQAIRMFFEKQDSVSTHTLASAACQVLADLCNNRKIPSWTRNKNIVKHDRWKEFREAITRYEAFFKHADNDPNGICEFHPEITPLFMIEAVELLRLVTRKLSWAGFIFAIWFHLAYPDMIQDGELKILLTERAALVAFDGKDFSILANLLKMREAVPAGFGEFLF